MANSELENFEKKKKVFEYVIIKNTTILSHFWLGEHI